ncbi:portal protein [Bacillus phage PBC4]|uniref:Portal protein n=1 Tax=Bacillus phage PBC4 TaxID=1675028 RepID=A0A1D6X842_9CAUD|nr:portal protein [Bacillus phage PBC4]AKQ08195.1 hypothetical protein PBC4_003 [Bacillus phage PBC4]
MEEVAKGGYVPKTEEDYAFGSARTNKEERERYSSAVLHNAGLETNKLLSDYQNNFPEIVSLAHFYADKIGLVKSSIRVYVTFTYGDILFDGGTKKNLKFCQTMKKKLKLNKILRQSLQDLYKAGNFFWFREKDSKGKTAWIHQLAPADVKVKGHYRDRPVAELKLNTTDESTVPLGLAKGNYGDYKLPLEQSYHCAIDREGYSRYGKSIITSAFEPIQHIEELMDMEKETIDQVIDFMIIFTIGDKDRPAGEKAINALTTKVQNLKNSSRLVGNHTLKAQEIKPDTALFNPEKYEVPMKMLLQSLGITPSIFTGEGSYATASAGMMSAKQTMENAREEIIDALDQLFYDMAVEAGLNPDSNPTIKLGKLNLTDEKIQHAILRDLYLDGIISGDTYAEQHGYNLEAEQNEIKEEKKYNIEPRPMSSTMSFGNEGGRPSDSPQGANPDNPDKKPSRDQ